MMRTKCLPKPMRGHFWFQFLALFFAGFSCFQTVDPASAGAQEAPVALGGLGAPFTIADFDGDGRPDIAVIETRRGDFSTTYLVLVQLSSSGQQSIQVAAPRGGLVIEALDVKNGNDFIDLVLTTASSRQPVAILINDGSGSFSQVSPSAFPDAFIHASSEWTCASRLKSPEVGCPLQQRAAMCPQSASIAGSAVQPDSTPTQNSGFFLSSSLLTCQAERAPPFEVVFF